MVSLAADLVLALDPARLLVRAGIIPDPWQLTILRERPMRALLLCCRQSGKSLTTAAAALHEALYNPGSLTLMLAPSQRQSAELLRQTRTLLNALTPAVTETCEWFMSGLVEPPAPLWATRGPVAEYESEDADTQKLDCYRRGWARLAGCEPTQYFFARSRLPLLAGS